VRLLHLISSHILLHSCDTYDEVAVSYVLTSVHGALLVASLHEKQPRACSVLCSQCHNESEGELAGLDPYRTPEIYDKGSASQKQVCNACIPLEQTTEALVDHRGQIWMGTCLHQESHSCAAGMRQHETWLLHS
jgi:hypothetical protein